MNASRENGRERLVQRPGQEGAGGGSSHRRSWRVGLPVWHFLWSCPCPARSRTARHESQEAGYVRVACILSGPFGCRAQCIAFTLLGSIMNSREENALVGKAAIRAC